MKSHTVPDTSFIICVVKHVDTCCFIGHQLKEFCCNVNMQVCTSYALVCSIVVMDNPQELSICKSVKEIFVQCEHVSRCNA